MEPPPFESNSSDPARFPANRSSLGGRNEIPKSHHPCSFTNANTGLDSSRGNNYWFAHNEHRHYHWIADGYNHRLPYRHDHGFPHRHDYRIERWKPSTP